MFLCPTFKKSNLFSISLKLFPLMKQKTQNFPERSSVGRILCSRSPQCKLKYSILLALQFISLLSKLTFCFSYDSSLPRSPPPYIHPKSGGCGSGDCHASSHAHPQRGGAAHAQSQDCGCTSCDCAGYTSEEVRTSPSVLGSVCPTK